MTEPRKDPRSAPRAAKPLSMARARYVFQILWFPLLWVILALPALLAFCVLYAMSVLLDADSGLPYVATGRRWRLRRRMWLNRARMRRESSTDLPWLQDEFRTLFDGRKTPGSDTAGTVRYHKDGRVEVDDSYFRQLGAAQALRIAAEYGYVSADNGRDLPVWLVFGRPLPSASGQPHAGGGLGLAAETDLMRLMNTLHGDPRAAPRPAKSAALLRIRYIWQFLWFPPLWLPLAVPTFIVLLTLNVINGLLEGDGGLPVHLAGGRRWRLRRRMWLSRARVRRERSMDVRWLEGELRAVFDAVAARPLMDHTTDTLWSHRDGRLEIDDSYFRRLGAVRTLQIAAEYGYVSADEGQGLPIWVVLKRALPVGGETSAAL
ncbi:hypothetical protein [Streptomyces sp. NPDC051569]|uniref:hypothetical protein n=1 Tax=Streptomyces sp. NPDC051569 TaxID=3365661 RepID=UPI0037B91CD0